MVKYFEIPNTYNKYDESVIWQPEELPDNIKLYADEHNLKIENICVYRHGLFVLFKENKDKKKKKKEKKNAKHKIKGLLYRKQYI